MAVRIVPTALFDLNGKVAIVTGGGNGIGAACCRMLADSGATVVIADLRAADAQNVADEITARGGEALAMECNVLHDEDLVALVQRTVVEYGGLHILVNNAGAAAQAKKVRSTSLWTHGVSFLSIKYCATAS
ncbi:SDR family NAD(P)-dependent oxidoreductase [Pseudomonas sp. B392_1p]|uniref:SDR family NAD(P)-dependent oxidoreductase n=1 Tax=Pseudomonas sp. B392_1p TaxID=3457507 RepID=UPI003FD0BC3D